jgi:hypothetical protein
VQYRKLFLEEPPIPARILPSGYPLAPLSAYWSAVIDSRKRDLLKYYRTLCG